MINCNLIENILDKYASEVDAFAYELACLVARDNQINGRGAFSDVEGIILYCLIRHFKPDLFFEISPDTGMSTNYILQAVGKNGKGKVVGFELEATKRQGTVKPTLEVIKENAVDPLLVEKYYELVVGDATKTLSVGKYGKPDGVLIDSCHENWFADWYIKGLLPHIGQFCLIQDISYSHKLEDSTEAQTVVGYLEQNDIGRILLDQFRGWLEINGDYFPIRNMLNNSILLAGNKTTCSERDEFPDEGIFQKSQLDRDLLTDHGARQGLMQASLPGGVSQFAPRYMAKILPFETNQFLAQQIANDMFGALMMSRNKEKDVKYCLLTLAKHYQQFASKTFFFRLVTRLFVGYPKLTVKSIWQWALR